MCLFSLTLCVFLVFASTACAAPVAAGVVALDVAGAGVEALVAGVLIVALGALVAVLFTVGADLTVVAVPSVVAACAKPLVPKASARLETASNVDTVVLSVFAFFISSSFEWLVSNVFTKNS